MVRAFFLFEVLWFGASFVPGGFHDSFGAEITTNAVLFSEAPTWLTDRQVDRVVDKVQRFLEWDIRRLRAYGYQDQAQFEKLHGYGGTVLAFTRFSDVSIHVGPHVNPGNFDEVFGHELAHAILFQKYKGSIPKWLEEGMANTAANRVQVDYVWLASQPPQDVTGLTHPFQGSAHFRYHYAVSTALVEMISSKCRLTDLLQLSVGKKLETYLDTFCRISNINLEFKDWLKKRAAFKHK